MLTHLLTWVCGRPVWVWRVVTLAEFRALPRVSRKAVQAKVLKWSGIVVCSGGVGLLIPPLLDTSGPAIGFPPSLFAPTKVPEPGSLALLLVGAAGVLVARRRTL